MLLVTLAHAATFAVPGDYATLAQVAAVVQDGDVIQLGGGDHAGATFHHEVEILGAGSRITSTLNGPGFWIEGVDFTGGSPCLYVQGDLVLIDSVVSGCSGNLGGGLHAEGGLVELSGVELSGNQASQGGAVWVNNAVLVVEQSTLADNEAVWGTGGALYAHESEVTLLGVELRDNAAYNGAAALLQQGGTLVVEDSHFEGNASPYGVGPVQVTGSLAELLNTIFEGEGGYQGGAVTLDLAGGEAWIEGCSFTDASTTYGVGGALTIRGAETVFLNSTDFEGSRAYSGGGALHLSQLGRAQLSELVVVDSATTYGRGGAVYLEGEVVTLVDLDLEGGEAYEGAGLLFVHASEAGLSDVRARDGQTTYGGGGVAWLASTTLQVERSVFQEGRAQGAGGLVLRCEQGAFLNNDVVGSQNAALDLGSCPIEVVNTLFAHNEAASTLPSTAGYNLFFEDPSSPGAHDIAADPLFVSWPDDLHLSEGSPAIDAGHPATSDPDGSVADIGAWWFEAEEEPQDTGDTGDTGESTDDTGAPGDSGVDDPEDSVSDEDVSLQGSCGCGGAAPLPSLLVVGTAMALARRRRR